MARSSAIYLIYDKYQEWVVAAFTVKHEAITAVKRHIEANPGRGLTIQRIPDAGPMDQAWTEVPLEEP